tara:strand:+ start:6916 stop:7230 length:315 start_codon:yes stop_codon:yes gene_type:complete
MENVVDNVENTTKEAPELTPQQLEEKRAEISKFYKDNIKHLKVQLEYETLLCDIEKRRAERTQAQMFMVQAQAAANGQQNPNAEQMSEEFEKAMKEGRTLKRTK